MSGDRPEPGWHSIPMGHRPTIRPLIGEQAKRLPDAILNRFREAYVPDVCDAVGPLFTMESTLQPLYSPMRKLVGQALTVKSPPGDNLTIWGALSFTQSNDILVVDWRGFTGVGAGGASSLVPPIENGLSGIVCDGGWRDISELRVLDLPIFARAINPLSPQKGQIGDINTAVCCGGVVVEAGDVIVADTEGIAVVPLAQAEYIANSLPDYTPPTKFEDWPLDARRRKSKERADQFHTLRSARLE